RRDRLPPALRRRSRRAERRGRDRRGPVPRCALRADDRGAVAGPGGHARNRDRRTRRGRRSAGSRAAGFRLPVMRRALAGAVRHRRIPLAPPRSVRQHPAARGASPRLYLRLERARHRRPDPAPAPALYRADRRVSSIVAWLAARSLSGAPALAADNGAPMPSVRPRLPSRYESEATPAPADDFPHEETRSEAAPAPRVEAPAR